MNAGPAPDGACILTMDDATLDRFEGWQRCRVFGLIGSGCTHQRASVEASRDDFGPWALGLVFVGALSSPLWKPVDLQPW